VISTTNTLKCWGRNIFGQLGYGDTENRGDGSGEMGSSLPLVSLGTGKTVVQVDGGEYHNVALFDDDTIKCWGGNNYGQLGYGDTIDRGDNGGEMGSYLDIVDLGSGVTPLQIELHLSFFY